MDVLEFKEILINKNLDVQIGSINHYNNSNINHIRKDHIVKDNKMTAYCSNNVITANIRPLIKSNIYSFMHPNLCRKCIKAYLKDNSIKL
jgi:hypothetical protein